MGALGIFLIGLTTDLVQFFAKKVTRKLAVVAVAIVVLTGLTAGLYATVSTLISGLLVAVPEPVQVGFGWILPSDLVPCLSAVLAARSARFVYDWQVRFVDIKLDPS